jgi:putative transposase
MRYIELNPVRAGMVNLATDYRWSSVHANTGRRDDPLVTFHDEYRALGATNAERSASYRFILAQPLSQRDVDRIRDHLNAGCALGGPSFQAAIAAACGRRADLRARGRPRRNDPEARSAIDSGSAGSPLGNCT